MMVVAGEIDRLNNYWMEFCMHDYCLQFYSQFEKQCIQLASVAHSRRGLLCVKRSLDAPPPYLQKIIQKKYYPKSPKSML